MEKPQVDDVNGVLEDVILKMNRISDHLREQGENEAAQRITRELISTFRYLFDVIASWDMQQSLMKPPSPREPSENKSVDPNSVRSRAESSSPSSTWAAVASITPTESNTLIKFRPADGLKRTIPEEQPIQNLYHERRVVWIQGWNETRSLSEVTESTGHGALYSMAYSPENDAVCIIFQHAASAQAFLNDHAEYVGRTGHSQFGPNCPVLPGNPFPENEDLRRMQNPRNERRRLTFARSQLFGTKLTEGQFQRDIEAIVGKANVELIWLFNTGNASVVFSAVPLARVVREHFHDESKRPSSPYAGVIVTFSHDPCERPMHLVTQMPNRSLSMGSYGSVKGNVSLDHGSFNSNHSKRSSSAMSRRTAGSGTKQSTDEDGWQTVGKRR